MNPFRSFALGLLAIGLARTSYGQLEIVRSPILSATLSTGSTWQVESSADGVAWTGTGVLIPGNGSPFTVRLDGLPASARYRLARLDGGDFVNPVMTAGFHLAGLATGASQVTLETSPDLGAGHWSYSALAFPDTDGRYLRALRPPLGGRAFLRASVPAIPSAFASLTSYAATPTNGYAGFGPVADDMPAIFQNGFVAAVPAGVYHRDGINAAAAGECYELTGPNGTATVMVGDLVPDPPAGTVDAGRSYFDLGTAAFQQLNGRTDGYATAGYRLVPAPVTGNLKMLVVTNSSGYYLELRPYNYRAGVAKLEVRSAGSGDWTVLPRSAYNSFVFNTTPALSRLLFPLDVRVTSRFDEVVTFPSITAMNDNDRIAATAQFQIFPQLAPPPAWMLGPVFTDSFGSIPGDSWSASGFSGATASTVSAGEAYRGAACLQVSALGSFDGVQILHSSPFPRPEFGMLEFAIRTVTATPTSGVGIALTGYDAGGASVTSARVTLPSIGASWRLLRIPLDAGGVPPAISGFQIVSTSSAPQPSILLDSISFVQP